MHGDSLETCARTHQRRWRFAALINTLLMVAVLVAACSNGESATDEDRQFATDRHTETPGAATEIPSEIPTEIPILVATPPASPVSGVVVPVSQVSTLYAIAEGGVIAIDVATGATRVIGRSDKKGDVIRIGRPRAVGAEARGRERSSPSLRRDPCSGRVAARRPR